MGRKRVSRSVQLALHHVGLASLCQIDHVCRRVILRWLLRMAYRPHSVNPEIRCTKLCPANETDTEDANQTNLFIQIIPECLSDAPVHGCRARVLQVSKRFEDDDEWQLTNMDSPLFLEWDYYGACEFTLEPGIRQRLNICWWSNRSRLIIPSVNPLPSKFRNVFNDLDTFKFDIRFTARDAEPVNVSVLVSLRNRGWNNPIISLIQGHGNASKQ